MTIRVVIVEDSPTMRAILMSRLSAEHDISVVATARDAAEGRELIREFDPDVVTLDIEMPGMNGLDFLEKLMLLRPTPVIIVSGATQAGNDVTARALALGAVDCYSKCDQTGGLPMQDGGRLANLIREAAQVSFGKPKTTAPLSTGRTGIKRSSDVRAIAIGSSTGGVEALQQLLRQFPEDCPPTMIVQHVNAQFAPAVARTLNEVCPARVVLAESDQPLSRGHVYFAPGERHMMVTGTNSFFIKLRQGDPVSGHLPSVDVLFGSMARTFGSQAVGIILTGMGADGAKGLLAMAEKGAFTIAQDEATCTVFGMPRAAINLGAASVVAPLGRIAHHTFSAAA